MKPLWNVFGSGINVRLTKGCEKRTSRVYKIRPEWRRPLIWFYPPTQEEELMTSGLNEADLNAVSGSATVIGMPGEGVGLQGLSNYFRFS
jgi:hypothetical protein